MRNTSRTRRRVSATEAAKGFGALVDRVREDGVAYIVERGGTPVAQIAPVTSTHCTLTTLVDHLRSSRPAADDAFARAVTAGMKRLNKPGIPRDPWGS